MRISTHIESDKDIGAKIKLARQKRHITLATLSDRIGIDPAVFSLGETGLTPFSAATIYKVACALGIGVNEFFSEMNQGDVEPTHALHTKICMAVMSFSDIDQLEKLLEQVDQIQNSEA